MTSPREAGNSNKAPANTAATGDTEMRDWCAAFSSIPERSSTAKIFNAYTLFYRRRSSLDSAQPPAVYYILYIGKAPTASALRPAPGATILRSLKREYLSSKRGIETLRLAWRITNAAAGPGYITRSHFSSLYTPGGQSPSPSSALRPLRLSGTPGISSASINMIDTTDALPAPSFPTQQGKRSLRKRWVIGLCVIYFFGTHF
ncbi:hypothetical protein EJ06DRAFT_548937 [Trichodelitschia bisporula]|uniref:Uncharacterized protein n=1 Tax=Trichodelitschia bisporula TaxID=703511 RepID=A0A6G1HVT5_9PEZI|nr:hypothetical protein EJ06DRAFT_548937 [Trichodelitschia bisporula]